MTHQFRQPKPSRLLMWLLGHVNRWILLLGFPVLRRIPLIRDMPGIRGYFWIRNLQLDGADLDRLRAAVNPGTASFLSPNHPEFGFDWIMDKEISTRVAPRMASWAAANIVDTAPGFWLRNNLVANTGAEAAMNYSVERALAGDGVLLHPEGSVHWTGSHVHPLFGGIAEMACAAARRAEALGKPVYIVPVVWRVRYARDISGALHREMDHIETSLTLDTSGDGTDTERADSRSVERRFRLLNESILERQMRSFGFDPAWVEGLDFFARQDAFRDWLIEDLETRYTVPPADSVERLIARIRRAIPYDVAGDRARADEALRLCGFSREVYTNSPLSQEQMAESLKRHRATLMRRGWRNVLHNYLPTPLGPRVVRVLVPEPIRVDPLRATREGAEYARDLLTMTRERMQRMLDADDDRERDAGPGRRGDHPRQRVAGNDGADAHRRHRGSVAPGSPPAGVRRDERRADARNPAAPDAALPTAPSP